MSTDQIVISASRRTDIPAFYLKWFMNSLDQGYFSVMNPYNRRIGIVPAEPQRVHSIVFWSKNYAEFLNHGIGEQLVDRGYHLYFHFTINSDNPVLEPRVPSLEDRLDQLEQLTDRFGPQAICWRFDPICYYTIDDSPILDNLADFYSIARHAAKCGVHQCITSFMNRYPKIMKRSLGRRRINFIDPDDEQKSETLLDMQATLTSNGLQLYTCCEKKLLGAIPQKHGIKAGSCLPNERLVDLYGGRLPFNRDTGQRISQGCNCRISSDVGSYGKHPCYHNCLYCYANPSSARTPEDSRKVR